MYRVISDGESKRFATLDLAMSYAKSLGTFVMITGGEFEIVGKFGVDEVKDPNYNGWISRKK
jgi:hypothetical protein